MLVAICYSQGSLLMSVNIHMYMTRIKIMIECYSVLNYPNSISDHMLVAIYRSQSAPNASKHGGRQGESVRE